MQAEGLLNNITKFGFIIALVVVKKTLGYVKGLTRSLQQRASDICKAYSELNNVRNSLSQVREVLILSISMVQNSCQYCKGSRCI